MYLYRKLCQILVLRVILTLLSKVLKMLLTLQALYLTFLRILRCLLLLLGILGLSFVIEILISLLTRYLKWHILVQLKLYLSINKLLLVYASKNKQNFGEAPKRTLLIPTLLEKLGVSQQNTSHEKNTFCTKINVK